MINFPGYIIFSGTVSEMSNIGNEQTFMWFRFLEPKLSFKSDVFTLIWGINSLHFQLTFNCCTEHILSKWPLHKHVKKQRDLENISKIFWSAPIALNQSFLLLYINVSRVILFAKAALQNGAIVLFAEMIILPLLEIYCLNKLLKNLRYFKLILLSTFGMVSHNI